MDAPPTARPLAAWRFTGTLRTYQQEVLTQIPAGSAASSMHIVAPPGSGKTLLGLLLAAREERRALVLAPTVTIRQQWARTARVLAAHDDEVSDDPMRLADLTVLTYQLLSVTGDGSPFDALAREQWLDELTASGRTEAESATWLAQLAVDNAARYAKGIRRRGRSFRRRFAQEHPDALARVLHPNAIALIDRIVESGVDTIVLDECHHLLDHWAIVVSYLAARIRERGGRALLIGLTATMPSPDDGIEFENYSQLLGDVDYEVPTPAVVKEGHLAPYQDLVWFTEPVPQEAAFISRHEEQLHEAMTQVLASPDGVRYLEEQLRTPAEKIAADGPLGVAQEAQHIGIERALSADYALAQACGAVLMTVAPQHPLCALLNPAVFGRASTDDLITVLARFALTRLLPDPAAGAQWRYVKETLADFGLHLTDRGIRRGRNPLESTLATSVAKDHAAVDIVRHELQGADAAHVRVVVVTDVVEAGNNRGLIGEDAPGALRVFALLASNPVSAALAPVLLTGQHLRATAGDAATIARALGAILRCEVEIADAPGPTRALRLPSIGRGRLVAAVSELMTQGIIRLLVGTRGLLGEGWDCPAVNTLIDLTTVATSAGSQQLRGRTLRLDPAWPEKAAHNWSVACLIPADVHFDDASEVARLRRRHGHLWGISADDGTSVVSGLGAALDQAARRALQGVLDKDAAYSIGALQSAALARFRDRARTRADWRIGTEYEPQERATVSLRATRSTLTISHPRSVAVPAARTFAAATVGATAAVAALSGLFELGMPGGAVIATAVAIGSGTAVARWTRPALRALHQWRDPSSTCRSAALVVWRALHDAGRVAALPDDAITVQRLSDRDDEWRWRFAFRGPARDRRAVADAVEELFGAVRTPRFLLAVGEMRVGSGTSAARRILHHARSPMLLPVPQLIARRRADAEQFAERWTAEIGPCTLWEVRGEEGLELLRIARGRAHLLDAASPRAALWG